MQSNLICILGLLLLFGCELDEIAAVKPPCEINAEIMVSPSTNCTGPCTLSITSTTTVTNQCEVNYFWSFGDGDTFLGEFPDTHSYTQIGSYRLVLTVQQITDPTNVDTATITIMVEDPTQPPVAVIEVNDPNCFGPCIKRLTGENSLNEDQYFWEFGDGGNSDLPNPEHTFAPSRTPYNVTLRVSNDVGEDTATRQIFANWRLFSNAYPTEDLGSVVKVMEMDDGGYVLIGLKLVSGGSQGIYSLTVDEDGNPEDLSNNPCLYDQLSSMDQINDAVLLPGGSQVVVIGTTKDANDFNDILMLSFNASNPCQTTPIQLGDDDLRENGQAIVALSGTQVAIFGKIKSTTSNDESVYFQRLTTDGFPVGEEQVITINGTSVFVTSALRLTDGTFWVSGEFEPAGNNHKQAFLLHLAADGEELAFRAFGITEKDVRFTAITTNQAETQLLATGFSESFDDPRTAVLFRANINNVGEGNLQELGTASVKKAQDIISLPDGQLVLAGGSAMGCVLQFLEENGSLGIANDDFGNDSNDQFNSVIRTSDGGFAAAGVRGQKIYFVKTDHLLSL